MSVKKRVEIEIGLSFVSLNADFNDDLFLYLTIGHGVGIFRVIFSLAVYCMDIGITDSTNGLMLD